MNELDIFKAARRYNNFEPNFKVKAVNVQGPNNCLNEGQIYDATWDDINPFLYVKVYVPSEKIALSLYWHCFEKL